MDGGGRNGASPCRSEGGRVIVGGRIGQVPYSIEDLWVRVKERFAADDVLRAVTIEEGHQYLAPDMGKPPKIVLVQDDPELLFGSIRGSSNELGTLTDACRAHVWGFNPGRDYRGPDQFLAAKALALEFCTAAYLSFSGMVSGGTINVASTTQILKYGESCIVSIRLRCPIEKAAGSTDTTLHIGGAETRISSGRNSASQLG